MSALSMVTAERERYAAYFEAALAEARSGNRECARELLIAIDQEALPFPYRYLRVDCIGKHPDGSDRLHEFWLDPPEDAEARGFQLGPVSIEIHPFTWCSAQIAFDRPLPDMGRLEALLTVWLDIGDANPDPVSGSARAIHSATPVETNGTLWYLTIDFGTAPADVMLDLIDFLGNEGMDRIIVLSHPGRPRI
jgi:hypothetical protein